MTNEIMVSVADDIDGGADVIERGGWVKHSSYTLDGRHCMTGAIHRQVMGSDNIHAAEATFWKLVGRRDIAIHSLTSFVGVDDVTLWNDAEERTLQEVLDVMRACAKDLRRKADEDV